MDTVLLKSNAGPFEFTRRVRISHENGNEYLAPQTYRFGFENGFRTAVPKQVWEELEHEYVDRKNQIRYKDILIEL